MFGIKKHSQVLHHVLVQCLENTDTVYEGYDIEIAKETYIKNKVSLHVIGSTITGVEWYKDGILYKWC